MSLKMKLTSAIIMFVLAIATLVIGVLAAQTQTINMEGTINFEISDRSLYVKNVRLEDPDGTITGISSFMPGYINDGITLSLGTHTVSNTSFKIHFDLINTTAIAYISDEVIVQEEGVNAVVSGTINPTSETIPEGETYAPITNSTPISGTITLTINAPSLASLDLSKITIIVREDVLEDWTFINGAVTGYMGVEEEITIPTGYSARTIGNVYTYSFQTKAELDAKIEASEDFHTLLWCGGYYLQRNGQEEEFILYNPSQTISSLQDTTDFPIQIRLKDVSITSFTQSIDAEDLAIGLLGMPAYQVMRGALTSMTISASGYDPITVNADNFQEVMSGNLLVILDQAATGQTEFEQLLPMSVTFGDFVVFSRGVTPVTSIGEEYGMEMYVGISNNAIKTVIIPDGILQLGTEAFSRCSSLTTITIPETVTSIGDYAFQWCSSLQTVDFGTNSSLQTIGSSAFFCCTSLQTVDFGTNSSLQTIGSNAFDACTSLTTITIPETVTSIGDGAFSGCTSLTTITIPEIVTSIGSAFSGCGNLQSVDFGTNSSLQTIGSNAFSGCSSLTTITIPEEVTSIGSFAFSGCTSLTTITIPETVTSIDDYAFSDCYALAIVYDNSTTLTITAGNSGNGDVGYYAKEVVTDGQADGNITEENNVFYYNNGTAKIALGPNGTRANITSVTLATNTTEINQYAFRDCTSLTTITVPEAVASIGNYAFQSCSSLTTVIIEGSDIYESATTTNACGELLQNATTVKVPTSIVSKYDNSFLEGLSSTTEMIGDVEYTVFTI